MPRIIRKALFAKLRALPALLTFMEDFQLATGLTLNLHDELGTGARRVSRDSPLCRYLMDREAGRWMCQRTQQALLARMDEDVAVCECDAGLQEIAVPLRAGGHTVGYLTFGGMRVGPNSGNRTHRVRHLLAAAGMDVSGEELEAMVKATREVPEAAVGAYTRLVSMAAKQFARQVTDHIMDAESQLPALAHRARRFIRAHALTGECSLRTIAADCGVSGVHLSRVFHAATGLTVSQYLARFRIEHACEMLKKRDVPVTEIAFASGFQSISQFNRTFKAVAGKTPSAMRRT